MDSGAEQDHRQRIVELAAPHCQQRRAQRDHLQVGGAFASICDNHFLGGRVVVALFGGARELQVDAGHACRAVRAVGLEARRRRVVRGAVVVGGQIRADEGRVRGRGGGLAGLLLADGQRQRLLERGLGGFGVVQFEFDLAEPQPQLRLLRTRLRRPGRQLIGGIGQALLACEHMPA